MSATPEENRKGRRIAALTLLMAVVACLAAGCGGSSSTTGGGTGGGAGQAGHGSGSGTSGQTTTPEQTGITISQSSGIDRHPEQGLTVTATKGTLSHVHVSAAGQPVAGTYNQGRTVWRSQWALSVDTKYTVSATGTGSSGAPETASFRTFAPASTFVTQTVEGYHQTYGVGMPIILYFNHTITNRKAVEQAMTIKSSKPVTGSWYWDDDCGTAPTCLYFRPHHYWKPYTKISFAAHLDGVEGAPGLYGAHTLTQSFTIGRSLTVIASAATHKMTVYKNGKQFAKWPISTGRPGDDTPNGTYLTIDKGNPVQMTGPGYSLSVPWSVRFTWSGDYLHDAYWSTGEQGFTNVSHGCVNMAPADAETYYKMELPGDPVKILGSPKAGSWDNGWTMWFLPWQKWLRGSALHQAVRVNQAGSTPFHPRA